MSAEHLAGPYREPAKLPPPEGDRLARYAVELELEEGERLLWAGRPPQGLRLTFVDIFMIPFSILFGGCAIMWEVLALLFNAPFFFALFGVPFVIIGVEMMIGRFFTDARERAHTYYGVTDQRAIIIVNSAKRKVKSLDIEEGIKLHESRDGSGSIGFADQAVNADLKGRGATSSSDKGPSPTFEKIQNARAVYQILKNAQGELQERRLRVEEPIDNAAANAGEEEEDHNEEIPSVDRVYRA